MYAAFSQKLNNLQLMSNIKPSFETSPAQKSVTIPLISSSSKRVSEKHSVEAQEDATMDSKMQHETVPLTSNKGEVLLVSPSAAQAQQARVNVKTEAKQYKHCQGTHKSRTITGKGTGGSKSKQAKHKSTKGTKSSTKTKGKSASGKKKASKSKKSTSAGKKKTSGKNKSSKKKVTSKGKAKKGGKTSSKSRK